jgi:DksA/TraR C4-type zinc finger protein
MNSKDAAQFKKLLLARRGELTRGLTPPAIDERTVVDETSLAPASPSPVPTNPPVPALLRALDSALARIEGGTYGICASCNREIGTRRLVAFPWATLCLPCQAQAQKQG